MDKLVIVRGGGDLATGVIYTLRRCGFPVLVLETVTPMAIRRSVAFSEAVYEGKSKVEDMECYLASSAENALELISEGKLAMLVDENCEILEKLRPWALVDAIIAKKNLGTHRGMAPKTIALGPGFTAGTDVDLVIETMRGHNLGRIIESGTALPNTGIPGEVLGITRERVIHAPQGGVLYNAAKIGDMVENGQTIAVIRCTEGETTVKATISGVLRGLLRDGLEVYKGLKIADIDPREDEKKNCFTISDKARCIAGSVLTGLIYLERRDGE